MKSFESSLKSRFAVWLILLFLLILLMSGVIFFYSFAPFLVKISAIIITVLIIFAVIFLPIFIKSFKICLENGQIFLEYGVVVRRKIVINPRHIIYITTIKSPICAVFNLRTVKICMVGYRLFVPMLTKCDAKKLLAEILGGEESCEF